MGDEWYRYQTELYRTKNGEYPENFFQMFSSEAIQQAYENNQWIDWIDEATKGNASQKDINLSLRGGSDKIKIYTSFSYNNTEGLLSNENQTRYGMRFNVDYQVRKWVKIGASSALTYTIKNSRGKNIFTKSLTAFQWSNLQITVDIGISRTCLIGILILHFISEWRGLPFYKFNIDVAIVIIRFTQRKCFSERYKLVIERWK